MEAGIRQGYPLSAILLNLSLEQVLRPALEVDTSDYLCDLAASIGLRFDSPKCALLAFRHSRSRGSVDGTALRVSGSAIPSLTGLEAYKYLGLRVGRNFRQGHTNLFKSAANNIVSIRDSLLAPWKKLHAIRLIILPRLDFACRNTLILKSQTVRLDQLLIATTKKILNLPDRANTALVHLSCRKGGAAMPRFRDLLDVHSIGHAFRSLSYPDAIVSDVTQKSLESIACKKIRSAPNLFALADYLNGSNSGPLASDAGDFSTVWSHSLIYIHKQPNAVSVAPSATKILVRLLSDELETSYLNKLASLPDQGKTIDTVSLHPASNHFIQAGHYNRFCDWNFIHRARLGVLQLNATKRFRKYNLKCRKCGYAKETVPHVLNHCKTHSTAWKRRHDAYQNHVARSIPSYMGSMSINKKFPCTSPSLIADLVLRGSGGETVIVDFTVAFEDRYESLVAARNAKIFKYQPILESLRAAGKPAYLDAIVVGALGSWDPANDTVLLSLGISRKYANLMRKLICSDVIRWSRDIYIEYLTDKRQY
ncbi:reverse transcriptase domain-containing protein [Trichonephila clavipes]|nr:reverse transcriptase domain-containing protein [Trichonephila clavipes]